MKLLYLFLYIFGLLLVILNIIILRVDQKELGLNEN